MEWEPQNLSVVDDVISLRSDWLKTHSCSRVTSDSFKHTGQGWGGIRLIVTFQPLMVISPTARWISAVYAGVYMWISSTLGETCSELLLCHVKQPDWLK